MSTDREAPGDGERRDERDGDEGAAADESRRDFVKKLPYVAPAIETFLLSDTVYAKKQEGRGRGRGRVSPPPAGPQAKPSNPPPPPPPPSSGSSR